MLFSGRAIIFLRVASSGLPRQGRVQSFSQSPASAHPSGELLAKVYSAACIELSPRHIRGPLILLSRNSSIDSFSSKNFFEQFRRCLLLFPPPCARLNLQQILTRATGVFPIVRYRPFQFELRFTTKAPRFFRCVHKIVRMQLPSQLQELLLQRASFHPKLARQSKHGKNNPWQVGCLL